MCTFYILITTFPLSFTKNDCYVISYAGYKAQTQPYTDY
jgi:hypothetical protein